MKSCGCLFGAFSLGRRRPSRDSPLMAERTGGDSSAPALSPNNFGHLLARALAADLVTAEQSTDLQRMMAAWQQRLSSHSHSSARLSSARISEMSLSLVEGVEMSPTGSRASSTEGARKLDLVQPLEPAPNVAFVTDVEGNWEYFVNYVNMSEALSFTDEVAADGTVRARRLLYIHTRCGESKRKHTLPPQRAAPTVTCVCVPCTGGDGARRWLAFRFRRRQLRQGRHHWWHGSVRRRSSARPASRLPPLSSCRLVVLQVRSHDSCAQAEVPHPRDALDRQPRRQQDATDLGGARDNWAGGGLGTHRDGPTASAGGATRALLFHLARHPLHLAYAWPTLRARSWRRMRWRRFIPSRALSGCPRTSASRRWPT